MRSALAYSLATLLSTSLILAQTKPQGEVRQLPDSIISQTKSLNQNYWFFGDLETSGETARALLIVLHGAGGIGTDIDKAKNKASRLIPAIEEAGINPLIVAPQATRSPMREGADAGWQPSDLNLFLDHLLTMFPINPDRVYLTGNSMGGYGTFAWAAASPERFAAIAPMVGGLGALGPKDITPDLGAWGESLSTLPMKAYFGAKDTVVPPDRGDMILGAIQKAGGTKAEVIVYEDLGHNAASRPYQDPEFFQWLFSHRREGWTVLFDGETLEGWETTSDANWRVEDHAIVVDSGEPGFLLHQDRYQNYELEVEFLAEPGTNSGVFLNTLPAPKVVTEDCYELNIAPPDNPFPTGSLVGRAKVEGVSESEEWRRFSVRVEQPKITVYLDGELLLEYEVNSRSTGDRIGLQFNTGKVAFRELRVRKIP